MAVVICFKIEFQIGHEYFKCVSFVLSAPCHSTEVRLWRLKIFDLLCPSDFVHCGDSSLVKLNDQFDESQSVFDCSNAELCTQAHQKDHWIVAWISFREKIIIPLSSRSSLSVFFFCRWTHQGQCSVCKNSITELGTQRSPSVVDCSSRTPWLYLEAPTTNSLPTRYAYSTVLFIIVCSM